MSDLCPILRPGIPDLETVGEKPHFDGRIAVVVTMGDRIDNRLGNHVWGKLIGGWRGGTGLPSADGTLNLAQHEVSCFTNLLKQIASVDLLRSKGASVFGAVAV